MQNQPQIKVLAILTCLMLLAAEKIYSQDLVENLEIYLSEYLNEIPLADGDEFVLPTDTELDLWKEGLNTLSDVGQIAAEPIFNQLNYQIISYQDSSLLETANYFLIEEMEPAENFWGTYVINRNPCRPNVVLQAPHTKHDNNTGKQAIYCFTRLSANGLMLAGTHRCNSLEFSSCDGTTSTCSADPDKFRNSDLAHNDQSIFQATTEWLAFENVNNNFIQLHGFSKKPDDPYLILSNGSKEPPLVDRLLMLAEALFNIDDSLSAKIPHIDTNWNRLVGFTNVQGRMLNASLEPCNDPAELNSGRFLHVEQERLRLRADSIGWEKMRSALASVYDCEPVSIDQTVQEAQIEIFPNPTVDLINIKANGISALQLWSIKGQLLFNEEYNNLSHLEIDLRRFNETLVFVRLELGSKLEWKKVMLVGN